MSPGAAGFSTRGEQKAQALQRGTRADTGILASFHQIREDSGAQRFRCCIQLINQKDKCSAAKPNVKKCKPR